MSPSLDKVVSLYIYVGFDKPVFKVARYFACIWTKNLQSNSIILVSKVIFHLSHGRTDTIFLRETASNSECSRLRHRAP